MNKSKQLYIALSIIAIMAIVILYVFDFPNNNNANESQSKVIFPKNENGQTYGSGLDAVSTDAEPDLISAYGVDGTLGYVLSKDLKGEMPRTPEEAVSIQRSKIPGSFQQIPLYDRDGKTVIGSFHIYQPIGVELKSNAN